MQIKKIPFSRIPPQQDYWLLGAVVISTLFILPLIWMIAVSIFKLTGNIHDAIAPESIVSRIDVVFYYIDWILILLSFAGYYLLDVFITVRLDSSIKQVLSMALFLLSIIALLGLHGLLIIKLMAGSNDAPVTEIVILLLSYIIAVSATITICFNSKIPSRYSRWITIIFAADTAILIIYSILALLPSLSSDNVQLYLKQALWLWTFEFSWVGSALTFLSIAFVMFLAVLEDRHHVTKRWLILSVDIIVVFAIIYAVFNINFFTYDTNFYLGPVYDVMHGKALLVNNYSQYGLLSIYGLSSFFIVFGISLTYGNFFLFLTILTIASYIFIYLVLLRGWLKNISISVLGIYMIVLWNYFGGHFYKLGFQIFPQVGFFRFGWWLPVMILLLTRTVFIRTGDRASLREWLHVAEIIIVSIAFFWEFDTGILILGAYTTALLVEAFYNKPDFGTGIRLFLRQVIGLTGVLLITFILISAFTFIALHKWPDWQGFIWPAVNYAKVTVGVVASTMMTPGTGIYILFIGVYVFSVIYIMVKLFLIKGKSERDLPVLAFITAYGIVQFIYYFGTYQAFRFQNVVVPLVIIICWLALRAIKYSWTQEGRAYLKRNIVTVSLILLITLILVSVPVQMLTYDMAQTIVKRCDIINTITERNDPNKWTPQNYWPEGFRSSVRAILEKEGDQKNVAIISYWDTYFLISTGKTNILDSNNLLSYRDQAQLDRLANQILSAKPHSVYIDHEELHGSITYVKDLKDKIAGYYYLVENVGSLDLYALRWKYRMRE